jgi:hypothetical protein
MSAFDPKARRLGVYSLKAAFWREPGDEAALQPKLAPWGVTS